MINDTSGNKYLRNANVVNTRSSDIHAGYNTWNKVEFVAEYSRVVSKVEINCSEISSDTS